MVSLSLRAFTVLLVLGFAPSSGIAQATDADIARLVAAMLGDTPMLTDLAHLTDGFGGRATGSRAEIERLIATTDLRQQMESMRMWGAWASGARGRKRP